MFFAVVIATNSPAANNVAAAANGLRDIKPPIAIPNPWFWVLCAAGALLLLALAVLIVVMLNRKRRRILVPPPIPAHMRAKQKLNEALSLIGNPLPFCVVVSDTIRFYLEEQFNFRAPERTTEEFLHELQSTSLLNADQKVSLGNFLERCDLVKFAKYEPGETELRELHSSAVRLVDETEPEMESGQTEPQIREQESAVNQA
jgi:hypothetical protein